MRDLSYKSENWEEFNLKNIEERLHIAGCKNDLLMIIIHRMEASYYHQQEKKWLLDEQDTITALYERAERVYKAKNDKQLDIAMEGIPFAKKD